MAVSPGGREVGRVSIRVLPDTSKFGPVTEAYLKRVEKTLKVEIPTALSTKGLEEDLVKLKARLRAFGRENKVTFKANIDSTSVSGAVKAASKAAAAATKTTPAKIKVEAATDDFFAKTRAIARKIAADTSVKLPLDADGEALRTRLKLLVKQIEQVTSVKVPVNAAAALGLRTQVRALLGEIEAIAAQAKPEIKVTIRADGDPVIADVKLLGEKLARTASVKLPVNVQGEELRLKLAALLEELHATSAIELPVNLDDKRALRARVVELVAEIEAIAKAADPKIKIGLKLNKTGFTQVKAELATFGESVKDTIGKFASVFNVGELAKLGTQLALIVARAGAYTLLLGPPLVLAAAGALALTPALASTLPILFSMGALVGVVVLGMDALFGPKVDGKRLGGIFEPVRKNLAGLKVAIGALLTQGLDPLVSKLNVNTVPALATGMKLVAKATNGALRELLTFLSTSKAVGQIKQLLSGAATSVSTVGHGLSIFTAAFLGLSVAALPAMQAVSTGLVGLAGRFNGFVQRGLASGKLQAAILKAVEDTGAFLSGLGSVALDLFDLLRNLEPVAATVFGAIGTALSGAVQGISTFIQKLGQARNNQGLRDVQGALGGLLAAYLAIAQASTRVLGPILSSAAFANFIDAVARATESVALAIAKILTAATSTVGAIAQVVSTPVLSLLTGIANAADGLADKIGGATLAVDALATALLLRLVPAITKSVFGTAVGVVFLNIAAGLRAVTTAAYAAATAVQAFGLRVGISVLLSSVTTALAGLLSGLKKLALFLIGNPISASIVALVAAVTLFKQGLDNIDNATASSTKKFGELNEKINGLDTEAVTKGFTTISKSMADSAANGAAAQRSYSGFFGTFRAGLDAITNGPLTQAIGNLRGGQEAINQLQNKANFATINLASVARSTGVDFETLRKIALQAGLDFGKPFDDPDSEKARQQLISDLDAIQAKTGLSLSAIQRNVGPSIAAWQQYAQAVADAVKATQQAFDSQTNIATNFQAPTEAAGALAKAQDTLKKKQQNLSDVEQRVAATRIRTYRQQVSGQQQVAKASQGVADAQEKVNKAQLKVNKTTLENQLKATLKLAQTFSSGIDTLLTKGLNPKIVEQLLEAGPKQATPVIEALLSDHSGRLIKLYNSTQTALDRISQSVVEKARLTALAVKADSDKLTADLATALNIAAAKAAAGPKANEADIAKKLGIPLNKVHDVATEFGITLYTSISDYLEQHRIKVQVDAVVNLPSSVSSGGSLTVRPGPGKHIPGAATGGLIKGPGTWTSDSVLTRLSNMEFVQPARSVDHYGLAVMEALRSRRIPKHVMAALANGDYASLGVHAPARVVASTAVARAVPEPELAGGAAMPRTLTVVDHDGVFRGQMRIAAARSHRQKRQAERLSRLGTWGD